MLEVDVAVAKVGKHATSESGDTFEMVERPRGGLSFVLADGQRSGKSAKFISNLVSRKAISLLGEGVRDEAAARAAHDYLYAYRGGKVSSTLNIVSILPMHKLVRLSRNNPVPVFVAGPEGVEVLDEPSQPVGFYEHTEPVVSDIPIQENRVLVVATDGLTSAGLRSGEHLDVPGALRDLLASDEEPLAAGELADWLLARAIELDRGRPADDISVLVVAMRGRRDDDGARRLLVRMPL
ncbi:MAG: SpoIIE family protein phosphatase [Anaerolineae bacterium]